MADFSPPNQFSNVAHKWVHDQKRDSVFFVKLVRKPGLHHQVVQHLVQNFNKTPAQARRVIASPNYATGFLIHQDGDLGYVLTCCHLLEDFYNDENIITVEHAGWFRFLVLCKHNEDYMEAHYPNLYDLEQDPRHYTPAQVVKLDQRKDLLLLQLDMRRLSGDIFHHECVQPHPPLHLAQHRAAPIADVVMLSWPPQRCDTVVIGQVVNYHSSYGQMTADRSKGYNMELMELKIEGEKGTSGSPILNHQGNAVALYHGRVNGKGYAVSLEEIINFLND